MTFNRYMQYWSIIAVGLSLGSLMFLALCFVNHVSYNYWKKAEEKEERNG